jgi:hypothetical protein
MLIFVHLRYPYVRWYSYCWLQGGWLRRFGATYCLRLGGTSPIKMDAVDGLATV